MNIEGFNKLTLLDYPEHVACTIFTGGCDLRCPFCHNSGLVLTPNASPISEEEIFLTLRRRRGVLEGVALTGGEPLLQPDVEDFLARVRELGYSIKLDTNGTHPERLAHVIEAGLVDYVAMDIKNSPREYARTVGVAGFDVSSIRRSAALLIGGNIEYEFRTTVVAELHDDASFYGIRELIEGADQYYLQMFVDSGALIGGGLHAPSSEDLRRYAAIASEYVGSVRLRGI